MKFIEIYEGLLQGKKYRLSYWEKDEYIYYHKETNTFKDDKDVKIDLTAFNIMTDIAWEEYIEPINYENCIGCLCRFWNDRSVAVNEAKSMGILTHYNSMADYKYTNGIGLTFLYCEPVKPEEIKFYGVK